MHTFTVTNADGLRYIALNLTPGEAMIARRLSEGNRFSVVTLDQEQPQPPTQEAVPDQPRDAGDNPPIYPGVGRS